MCEYALVTTIGYYSRKLAAQHALSIGLGSRGSKNYSAHSVAEYDVQTSALLPWIAAILLFVCNMY